MDDFDWYYSNINYINQISTQKNIYLIQIQNTSIDKKTYIFSD